MDARDKHDIEESYDEKIVRLKRELASVPTLPGVYLWKDKDNQVIYVGKAKQLRARMRQYISLQDSREKTPLLVAEIDSFDYIVVENEHESLILEKNLINQYAPFYNADFKDDKSYPFIALTCGDDFPAIKFTREKHVATSQYFGPYTDSRAARAMVDIARRIVPLCSASCSDWRSMCRQQGRKSEGEEKPAQDKPCFDAHVGLSPGACCGSITREEYTLNVKKVARFLSGHHREFIDELEAEMNEAAEDLDFERAARIKSRIDIVNSLTDKQHAVTTRIPNADVIGIFREETIAAAHVFSIREGRIINSNEFILNRGLDIPSDELARSFILRYYDVATTIPSEIVTRETLEDADIIEGWLTEKRNESRGAKVRISIPLRGEKAELLTLAEKNARHTLLRYKTRTNYDDKRVNEALLQLESALALEGPPMRIECFDISTIHGSYTVASMVVFTAGKPDKNQYRRFRIKTPLDEANDFLSMQEVIRRRYRSARLDDERFGQRPDLIILDGGKPQLTAALGAFEELGVDDIALCGLAKRDEEIFVPWQESGPVVLPGGSASLYLIKKIRDEAHRFAITYHRELRGKGMTSSILDSVAGLGPVRKKALMKEFKSFKRLKSASREELLACKVLPTQVAEELYRVLQTYNGAAEETETQ